MNSLVLNVLKKLETAVKPYRRRVEIFFKPVRSFEAGGRSYTYLYHPYNKTYKVERAVEVPIVWAEVRDRRAETVLEVGNVLSHYYRVSHDIIDKYEQAEGVLNEDIVDFNPEKRYDLIVSISTLEHVGWDESPRTPEKVVDAYERLKSLLAPGGEMVVTVPVAQNPFLDEQLGNGRIDFDTLMCLKRISRANEWVEVAWDEVRRVQYGTPYRAANGVVVGRYRAPLA